MEGYIIEYRTNRYHYVMDGSTLFLTEREWRFYGEYNSVELAREALTILIVSHKNNEATTDWEFRIQE
jgi:hypothetical protein